VNPEVTISAKLQLGEGPSWDADAARLIWVDILGKELFVLQDECHHTFKLNDYVSAGVPIAEPGRILITLGVGVSLLDLRSGQIEPIALTDADPQSVRVNDAKVDPAGNLWLGTMSLEDVPSRGALYRLGPGRTMHKALDGISVSNGPAWSPAGNVMYYTDSPTASILSFDFDPVAGELIGKGSILIDTSPLSGIPDGMTVDAKGNLWVAFWDGGCVRCFSDRGELLDTIYLPVSRPTSCTFGGADLDILYITSARTGLALDALAAQPLSGSLFAARPGVRGRAEPHAKIHA
jgi:sugar lactone lactonase YvrE